MQSFFVIVKDFDKGTFSVEGPMVDDTRIINQVCEVQNTGRRVNCEATKAYKSIEELRISVEKNLNLKYSEDSVLL
ncbi:hypothetical protein J0676_05925 [Vibrio sp. Vb2880]|uniref:hypothetical protein n=1 Tax=Vibrio TaxID=662 RepID=UPI00192B6FB7|nr:MULTISPECIES: hypothetical protein [Vibrio]MBL4282173.1 hypothetical protein [Vibrio fluvialis]MBO0213017.1 hypothetical protein [Vibrio sp. Vb2880]HDM8047757.1 hypothetical protein [Vibrio fluvialis]